jgi:hypothetical protein
VLLAGNVVVDHEESVKRLPAESAEINDDEYVGRAAGVVLGLRGQAGLETENSGKAAYSIVQS